MHVDFEEEHSVINKLCTTFGKFGEFGAQIAWVGCNHFINTKFSKLSKVIADPNHYDGDKYMG